MDKIVSLCKRRGFVFPSSEIYGGFSSTWDYGPLGSLLKNNVKNAWIRSVVQERDDMVLLDAAILMHPQVWQASGHLDNFTDPLVDCKSCKQRFRADQVEGDRCSACGGELTEARQFNMMFKTFVGPVEEDADVAYLRPETAQGIFANFKNVATATRRKLPFGIAQVGKAFRNEITPGNFTFRTREFEQMEIEYFVAPGTDMEWFNYWKGYCVKWLLDLKIKEEHIKLRDHEAEELSHYSNATTDIEFLFPFGWGELWGIADRTDFDLKQHIEHSGQEMNYIDPETNEKYVPYCIEPSLGADRVTLAFLVDAYDEEILTSADVKEDTRTVLHFHPAIAPFKAAILPLAKNLSPIAEPIFEELSRHFMIDYDETGSIGKRYRREDEIGTPFCICVDFDTQIDGCVTIRDRDTMEQIRIPVEKVKAYIEEKLIF